MSIKRALGHAGGWAITAVALSFCMPAHPTREGEALGASVVATHLSAPSGTPLAIACTPTGPELCFNAADDNCNGVIDEGCGEETGLLQFTIAWGSNPADVNLSVTTPDKEHVPNEHTHSAPNGFEHGRDCPGSDGCGGQNIENVYFDGLEPPRGHYVIDVSLGELDGAPLPVPVHFGARLGGHVVEFAVDLAPGDGARKTFSFDLP